MGSVDKSWKHASHPPPQLLGTRHLSLPQGSWGLLSHVEATCRASGMCRAALWLGWSSVRGRQGLPLALKLCPAVVRAEPPGVLGWCGG